MLWEAGLMDTFSLMVFADGSAAGHVNGWDGTETLQLLQANRGCPLQFRSFRSAWTALRRGFGLH